MHYFKYTRGVVCQVFAEDHQMVSQDFKAEEETVTFTESGIQTEPRPEDYAPFEMVQPGPEARTVARLDGSELSAVLASLRLLQRSADTLPREILDIYLDGGGIGLGLTEIDELCERLNLGG